MRVADGEKRSRSTSAQNGKLVACALDLSRPKKKQRNFFGKLFKCQRFGKAPTARLAVIKQKRARAQEVQAAAPEPRP